MALVFYYKDMLEKVTMKRTQQFSAFSLLPKSPIYMQRVCRKSKNWIEWKIAISEIRLFLENHTLESHKIWHENTLGISNWNIEFNNWT